MITISSSPQDFTPAFNPVNFVISSDNYDESDFKFVADVYDGDANLLATLKYQPQVVGSSPIEVDVSRTIQELVRANYCKLNSLVSPSIVQTGDGAVASYSVQFGEQYGGVVYANLASFSGFIFNGAINYLRFPFYLSNTYKNARFLTYLDRQVVRRTDSSLLSIIQSDDTAISGFDLQVFNQAGVSLHTETIDNPYDSLSVVSNRLLHLHCGFSHLYASLGFSASVYNQAAYYTLKPSGGTAMRFDLWSLCERFPGRRLYFLNELGGFDSFNFTLAERAVYTTEKKNYLRQPVNKVTGYDSTTRRFEAQRRNYNTKVTESLKVTSDYLTDTESDLLVQLMTSPLIYMEANAAGYGGSGQVLIPVDIKVTEYIRKRTAIDKLFNQEMDIELTHTSYRQTI